MKAKLSTFERERNGLRVAVSAIGAQLADENWNLRMVEYHLVQHSSGIVSPNDWDGLNHLGALTGCDAYRLGRYPISIVRNLRHNRKALHLRTWELRAELASRASKLAAMESLLPGMTAVPSERADALAVAIGEDLTARLREPKPLIFKRTREVEAHSPLFSNSDANPQGRLF